MSVTKNVGFYKFLLTVNNRCIGLKGFEWWILGTKKDANRRLKSSEWWPLRDSNTGPADYESDALTN